MNGFVEAMKESALAAVNATNPVYVLFGTVESTQPLSVRVSTDVPPLREDELILTDAVRDYTTKISFDNPDLKQVFTTWDMQEERESTPSKMSFKEALEHDITVYNALKAGEKVILLRVQGGQKFIVLDRTEGRN